MAKSSQNTCAFAFMGAFCGFLRAGLICLALAAVFASSPPVLASESSNEAASAVSALPVSEPNKALKQVSAEEGDKAPAASESSNIGNAADKALAARPQNANAKTEPGMFDFDPLVLVSQVINFFLLLIILNYFIFKPLDAMVAKRHEEIAGIKRNAEKDYKDASALKNSYERRIANIEQESYELKQKAIAEANVKAQEIIDEAHKKADEIIEQGEMNIFLERQSAWAGIREEVTELTMMASEKVIEASLNDETHRELIRKAIDKLANSIEGEK